MSAIVCYVLAGFFVYAMGLVGFMRGPDDVGAAFTMIVEGVCAVPFLFFLLIGLALSGFKNWKRDLGVVLLSGTGVTATVALSFACMLYYPEYRKLLPPDFLDHIDNYAAGAGVNVGILVVGVALLLASRGSARPATEQNSMGAGPGTGGGSAADLSNPYRSLTYPR
ncbi:MAG TPA: hypothetical protein VG433_15415 [Pirellulales bacterium]|nr:hypothetical protein [Pirellulales bacterium]